MTTDELKRLSDERDAWRKACRFLYDVAGEGGRSGRPMDLISKRAWQRVVELIREADKKSNEELLG